MRRKHGMGNWAVWAGLALALPLAACDDDSPEVTCGGGTRLEGDTCMPVEGLTCGDGTHLDGETCAPDVTCGSGTEDVDGSCLPTEGLTCGDGTEEDDGACVGTLACGSGTEQDGDECLPTEGLSCGDGTVQEGDECLPESIVVCGEGTHLEGGSCLPDSLLACGPQTHEDAGQCIPDPETLGSQYGIFTAEQYDSSGDDVLPDTTDHTYVYVNTGISFGATATKNGVHVFDYDAVQDCINDGQGCPDDNEFLPIASVEVDTPIAEGAASTNWSSHALAVSPDGQWVYQAFLVPYARYSFVDYSARFPQPATWFYKINARTLLPEKRIDCGGPTHHMNIVNDRYMMTECYSEAGVFFWDPENDDEVVKVFPYGKFEGYPYLAFESPPLEFINADDPPRYLAVTVSSHNNTAVNAAGETEEVLGYVALINETTMKQEAAPAIGPFGIWARFSSDGSRMWTTSADDDMVRRYDLSLNAQTNQLKATLAAEIEVGPGPYGLELNADETLLYVDDKAEGVRAGQTSVHGSTVTVIDADAASDTYDSVVFTIGLSMDAATEPHRPDHMYLGPDDRMWQCSNANQSCQVIDPEVTPSNGGVMTECTRIRTAHEFPACDDDTDCPLGLACDVNGKCGGTTAILETIECMEAPILASIRMPDADEVPGWTVGRGDPHSVVWVRYDANGDARVIQDFVRHE